MKRRDLEKHLHQHGCELARHGGNHDYWMNAMTGALAPIPRSRELRTGTSLAICDQLGIPRPHGKR